VSTWFAPGETDLLSNATRIVMPGDEDPRPWLGVIATGNRQLLTFIHEMTHHWCFDSIVVNAQRMIATRAETNAVALATLSRDPDRAGPDADTVPHDEEPSPEEAIRLWGALMRAMYGPPNRNNLIAADDLLINAVADDLIRLEVTQALFRPLAEGLALFAEYDAISRSQSSAWGPVPAAVAWNFAGLEKLKEEPYASLPEPFNTMVLAGHLIEAVRLSADAVAAKASVLAQPFASMAGGYLPGYLAVKNMWRHLYKRDIRLYSETDLVLAYLRSFFYEDPAIGLAILAPTGPDPVSGANAIISAFRSRVQAFETASPEAVTAFEAHLASGPARTTARPGMLYSEAEGAQFQEKLDRAANDCLPSAWGAKVFPTAVDTSAQKLDEMWSRRHSLIACSVPVTIAAATGQALDVRWAGKLALTVQEPDLLPPLDDNPSTVTGEGRLDVLLIDVVEHAGTARAAVVSREGRAVSCTVWGPPEKLTEIRSQALGSFQTREERLSDAKGLGLIADWVVKSDFSATDARDQVREALPDIVDDTYRDTALWHSTNNAAIDHCAALMRDRGMYAPLGSVDMLRRTALLGLAASLNANRPFLDRVFRENGYDLADTIDRLDQCRETHGFPPRASFPAQDGEDDILVPLL
jgi:hypothetical protein